MSLTLPQVRLLLTALLAVLALGFVVAPQPAQANTSCNVTQPNMDFGSALTTTVSIQYSCTNFDPSSISFTLCLRVGTPSFPGTVAQPKLQSGADALNYNLYTDAAATQVWTTTNFLTRAVTIPANQTSTGSFLIYGKIPAGQVVPVGTYQGQMFNTRLGFKPTGVQSCEANLNPGLQGVEFTLNVKATVAASCTLGTIGLIDFGAQSGLFKRADAAGSVQLTCPVSRAWTLSFDGGRNSANSTRRMRDTLGNYVPYRLYRDANRSNLIAINGTIGGTGTGSVQTTPIYGRVEPDPPPTPGQYQDFIVVTLSF
ncbi:spore coat U domain-containing protein [Altererythrobacter sp. Root672]|uniref:Csu type fimbrial protein n=1 Tax=Altererythrobacter sp. Root672 TaxID=1736584 RepID=UPI0006FE6E3B|nr:spore coat U domain-containing protein [Altererythrobacter sp. Root672]KRA83625.1 hypothetical protein ASD76_06225 [Altererythrobacter sp. Root672]